MAALPIEPAAGNGYLLFAGLYILSAGRDARLVLWEASTAKEITKHTLSCSVTGITWSQRENCVQVTSLNSEVSSRGSMTSAILYNGQHGDPQVVNEEGMFGEWRDVVPSEHSSPFMSLDEMDMLADKETDRTVEKDIEAASGDALKVQWKIIVLKALHDMLSHM